MSTMRSRVLTADLGPNIAWVSVWADGGPAVVVNRRAAHEETMRHQAADAVAARGFEPSELSEVLYGVCG